MPESCRHDSGRSALCPVAEIVLLSVLLAGVVLCRHVPGAGEFYAREIYPFLSFVLSAIASVVPFSLDEWLVVSAALGLLVFPFAARRRGWGWGRVLLREALCVLWIYVWFYAGWGLNYYRDGFYQRAGVAPAEYDAEAFRSFLDDYTSGLDSSYRECLSVYGSLPDPAHRAWDRKDFRKGAEEKVKHLYRSVPEHFGLSCPKVFQHPKFTCFNPVYSGVGVLGFMGPFFAESHVNRDLSVIEYPFTYAHELSHLLGVSSEAEANFWAYNVCVLSDDTLVRYSGFFSLLPYVVSNARGLLSEDEFKEWIQTVEPAVLEQLRVRQGQWRERYSPFIGRIQNAMYEAYLKGNRISSGQKNYGEVILLLMSVR